MKPDLAVIHCEPLSNDIVERLKALVEEVESGRMSAFAAAVVYRDGTTGDTWSALPNRSLMIGAIERMKHALLVRGCDE